MSASDPLTELRRQRALMQEHLAWLDAQIRRAEQGAVALPMSGQTPVLPESSAAKPIRTENGTLQASSPTTTAAKSAGDATTEAETDTILAQYRTASTDLQRDVRTGCLLYFAAAVLILGAVVTIMYFALRRS